MNVAGRKNAALFEWAAFVKAEKEELALRVILDLFVEYWLQCRIEAGLFLMRFLIMYTLMYTVFFGCFGQKPLSTSLTIEVCNYVQACCPARAYCS